MFYTGEGQLRLLFSVAGGKSLGSFGESFTLSFQKSVEAKG
ncbi:MAG: hypothetical protein ACLSEX_04455 [Blautia sp.]